MPPQLPSDADLSPLLSPARDQGPRGTCTAFAATALHEAVRTSGAGAMTALSEEVLYWGAKQADRNYNPGTSFRSAHFALGRWGQPEAALWPYDPSRNDGDAGYAPPPAAIDPANCHRARLEAVAVDIVAVRGHLAAGRPVAVSVRMSLGFFTAANGRIPLPQPHELLADNHAVLLTGYHDGRAALRFRNSWGGQWGVAGYGELPYDYFTRHGQSANILRITP